MENNGSFIIKTLLTHKNNLRHISCLFLYTPFSTKASKVCGIGDEDMDMRVEYNSTLEGYHVGQSFLREKHVGLGKPDHQKEMKLPTSISSLFFVPPSTFLPPGKFSNLERPNGWSRKHQHGIRYIRIVRT
ncbi:hypothetical protein KQX54_008697 [Cotesia glomerata]|uniref:Uncharacterized protein n=1 Tax=Cotesia glomerata TaxID=32391 RepID=A0AAV7J5L0_COTGL|nr:hypothetical protein KQX54_008697 [Cotesia glomerata]